MQSFQPISFKHLLLHYITLHPKWFLLFRFSKPTLYYLLLYHMHATFHIFFIVFAIIMLIIYVEQ